jgi:carbon storage regulator CsrA
MLVLSRRLDEKILLPTIPAVIKVISSQAGLVRLGIEAPSDVPILREELAGQESALPRSETERSRPRHLLRNRLHNLTRGLKLLRKQLADAGTGVRETLDDIEDELQDLKRLLASSASAVAPTLVLEPSA